MTDEQAEAWRETEIGRTGYRKKLRLAREKQGLIIHEAAQLMANSSAYYDIEQCDRDLTDCYSLHEIKGICEKLGIHPRDLFCDDSVAVISMEDVIERIEKHCTEKKLSISEFENIAGWELENCLAKPSTAFDEWNVDCLIDVSRELGIDWRCVIAGL